MSLTRNTAKNLENSIEALQNVQSFLMGASENIDKIETKELIDNELSNVNKTLKNIRNLKTTVK